MSKSRQNSNVPNRLSVANRAQLRSKAGTVTGELIEQADIGLMYAWDTGANIDDKGTVIADDNLQGFWIAQYSGAVNVKWFGDVTLQQTWLDASNSKQSVEVDNGSYALDGNTISFTGKKFHSYGAVTITVNTTITVNNLNP